MLRSNGVPSHIVHGKWNQDCEKRYSAIKRLKISTTKQSCAIVEGGKEEVEAAVALHEEKGAHLRAQPVIHNTVWPPHTTNRKYLCVCVCVWARQPFSLDKVCGRKKRENISGSLYHIPSLSLLPGSPFLPSLPLPAHHPTSPRIFSLHPGRAGRHSPTQYVRVFLVVVCGTHVWLVGWVISLNLVEVGGGTSWLWQFIWQHWRHIHSKTTSILDNVIIKYC